MRNCVTHHYCECTGERLRAMESELADYGETVSKLRAENKELRSSVFRVKSRIDEMVAQKSASITSFHNIEQTLGKALGYPWYKDDQKNFPESTEADGVCVGEHVAESIASEAASEIVRLRKLCDPLKPREVEIPYWECPRCFRVNEFQSDHQPTDKMYCGHCLSVFASSRLQYCTHKKVL
jgi:hypothetical protein